MLTPLHRAAASQNEVCSYFETQKRTSFSQHLTPGLQCLKLSFEICVSPQKAVQLLLKHKAEVNTRDKFWHTPLHMAAAKWATGCASALIPHVCSLDVADKSGRTPLHHAAYSGHGEVNCKVVLSSTKLFRFHTYCFNRQYSWNADLIEQRERQLEDIFLVSGCMWSFVERSNSLRI